MKGVTAFVQALEGHAGSKCNTNEPSGFTSVGHYRSWIDQKIAKNQRITAYQSAAQGLIDRINIKVFVYLMMVLAVLIL